MAQYRKGRISEEVKREISDIIQRELKDPRLDLVSIVNVDVAGDLKTAKVYVSSLKGAEATASSVEGLRSAAGFIRSELSRRLKTRTVPELTFIADDSIEHGIRISKILSEVSTGNDTAKVEE